MDYRQKIIDFLLDGNSEGWFEWLKSKPLLDQVDILNELREIVSETAADMNHKELNEALKLLEEKTNAYQDAILDEQVTALKLEMAEEEREKVMKRIDASADGMRAYILECISTHAPNAEEMKALGRKMIQYEKAVGRYNAADWIAFDHETGE